MERKPAKFVSIGDSRLASLQEQVLEQSQQMEAQACQAQCFYDPEKEISIDIDIEGILSAIKESEAAILHSVSSLSEKNEGVLRAIEEKHIEALVGLVDVKRKFANLEVSLDKRFSESELTLSSKIALEVSYIQSGISKSHTTLKRIVIGVSCLQLVQILWMFLKF